MSLMQLLAVGQSFRGTREVAGRYKMRQNWFPRFGPGEEPGRAAGGRASPDAVIPDRQGALCGRPAPEPAESALERVKVMRNDLSEAGVEVVAVRRGTAARSARSETVALPGVVAGWGRGWGWLVARLFGSGGGWF